MREPANPENIAPKPDTTLASQCFAQFEQQMQAEFGGLIIEKGTRENNIIFKVGDSNAPEGQKQLGDIEYENEGQGKLRLRILVGKSNKLEADAWKPRGIGTALLAYLLLKFPETRNITGELGDDNWAVYQEAEKRGLAPRDAFKSTPMFKMLYRLGFGRLSTRYDGGSFFSVWKNR